MKNKKKMRENSLDQDENSLSADSSASTLFANSAIFVFGPLRIYSFNLYFICSSSDLRLEFFY